MNENLKSGEVICKLTKEEAQELKRISVIIESIDQRIDRLEGRRIAFCELRTDWWEKIFDKYYLIRGFHYNVNWNTRELTKI